MKRVRLIVFIVGSCTAWYDALFIPGTTTWVATVGMTIMGLSMASMIGALEAELRQTKQALEQAQYKAEFWKTAAKEGS